MGITSDHKSRKNITRALFQGVFLLVFVFLALQGRLQLWILLLGLGILGGVFFGRLYCGWICPMGTVMRLESWIYRKLGIQRKNPVLMNEDRKNKRYVQLLQMVLLLVFFGGVIATQRFGIRINLILFLVLLGSGTSLVFKEEAWHRICPHGVAMSLTAGVKKRKSKKLIIEKESCIGCGKCEKVCPNLAVVKEEGSNIRSIVTKDCLTCFECQKACPVHSIAYR